MRRIFKSEDVVKIAKAVQIPDCVVRTVPVSTQDSTVVRVSDNENAESEETVLEEDIALEEAEDYEDESAAKVREDEMIAVARQELTLEREKMIIEKEAFLKQAQTEAAMIIEEAEKEKRSIIDKANSLSEKIMNEAREKGYEEGIREWKKETEKYFSGVGEVLEELKKAQEEYFDEYASELKLLSLEIAEKVIAQKLLEEPMSLLPLVKSAIKSIREVSWIKVEISDKLKSVAAELEKAVGELKPEQTIEVELRRDADPGTCVVHTAEGVTVATVKTQLENIREYFMRYKDSEDDEPKAGSDQTEKKSETQ